METTGQKSSARKSHEQQTTLIPEVETIGTEYIQRGREYRDSNGSYSLNIVFDLNRSGEEWLNILSHQKKMVRKQKMDLDLGDFLGIITTIDTLKDLFSERRVIKGKRRALRKLRSMARISQISWGYAIEGVNGSTVIHREPSESKRVIGLYSHNGINYDKDFTADIWEKDLPSQSYNLSDYTKEEVLSVKVLQDQVCPTCHGQKMIRCPNCGGSGREQYVDGYFASGEERIKTGACHECFGKGQIPCPDCSDTGMAGGNGIISEIKLYEESFTSNPTKFVLTPWSWRTKSGGAFRDEDTIVKYKNKKNPLFDKKEDMQSDILSQIGLKYKSLLEFLFDSVRITNEDSSSIVDLFMGIRRIYRVICIEYYLKDKHFVFYISETGDKKCKVHWNHRYFPSMNLFGKVKYGIEERD